MSGHEAVLIGEVATVGGTMTVSVTPDGMVRVDINGQALEFTPREGPGGAFDALQALQLGTARAVEIKLGSPSARAEFR